jgi:hypothetical protein
MGDGRWSPARLIATVAGVDGSEPGQTELDGSLKANLLRERDLLNKISSWVHHPPLGERFRLWQGYSGLLIH